jgi:hypothetical protein
LLNWLHIYIYIRITVQLYPCNLFIVMKWESVKQYLKNELLCILTQ